MVETSPITGYIEIDGMTVCALHHGDGTAVIYTVVEELDSPAVAVSFCYNVAALFGLRVIAIKGADNDDV